MEIANRVMVRQSSTDDAAALRRLLEQTRYTHLHLDWKYPADWLGTPEFYLAETGADLIACLAVAADPPPAAWVRVAAVENARQGPAALAAILNEMLPRLRRAGVNQIGWLWSEGWPESWAAAIQFRPETEIVSLVKEDLFLPDRRLNPAIAVRPVRDEDLSHLAAIEEAAFEPLWRHSEEGLRTAWKNALCFDVAEVEGRLIGFQYSAHSRETRRAHLVRMTVHPQSQGMGAGSAILYRAIEEYRQRGLTGVTLNTQVDNLPSQRLYAYFGFRIEDHRVPVWVRSL